MRRYARIPGIGRLRNGKGDVARKDRHSASYQPAQWGQEGGSHAPRGRHAAEAPHGAHAHQAAAPEPSNPYSAAHDSALIAQRRRQRKRKRVVCIVAAILAVLVVGAGVAFGVYSAMLNDRLALHDESEMESVDDALVSADLNKPFYMLAIGSDSREGSGTSSRSDESGDNERSDVMILVRVDAPNRQLTLVSIPRDTPLHLEDGSIIKMNEAYNHGGAAATIEAVSDLTGVPISHYAEVHFSELQQLVDNLGGVTVNVPIELSYSDALTGEEVTLYPGEQTLDGQQAQIFARARHEYSGNQDANRQNSVRQLAMAIVEKALNRPVYEIPGAMLDVAGAVSTDMNTADLIALATAFAGGEGDVTMYSGTGPTEGGINDAANGLWFCYESPEGWAKLMDVVDSGGDPSGIDYSDVEYYHATP